MSDSSFNKNLENFIKYCLSYVKLTRERTVLAQQKYSVELPKKNFGLEGLLNGDSDGSLGELINFPVFYKYDPKKVPEELKEQYSYEKELANKVEDIYNKYRNDQFTKQIIFNFGFFDIELPQVDDGDVIGIDDNNGSQTGLFEDDIRRGTKVKSERYPLFGLPVKIEKEFSGEDVNKYFVYFVDSEVQVNIGMMQTILGDDQYFQLLEDLGKYEVEQKLSLPITDLEVFREIWHKIKAQLRLKDATFDENSFSLDEARVALSPKANYFLAEDLAKLSQLTEEELSQTALTSWVDDSELNMETALPEEKELYFPFKYDKYQLSTLSLLGNKAAIVQGPPGTGKSETISNILCHLAANGKRVLFVSQKAQALKVVKDKLNKLKAKYLYGYLPNPNSAQIGEEDEADGVAPQLSALNTYIQRLGYKLSPRGKLIEFYGQRKNDTDSGVEEVVKKVDDLKSELNSVVALQRQYYQLEQELKGLKEYDFDIPDINCFEKSFSSSEWDQIKALKSQIESLEVAIRDYETSESKKNFESMFKTIDTTNQEYAGLIKTIYEDVSKTGYDRHHTLLRKLNVAGRLVRLSDVFAKLPREINDQIRNIMSQDLSRSEASQRLRSLYLHFSHYENQRLLETVKNSLQARLYACGVTDPVFKTVDGLVSSSSAPELESVKDKIVRVQQIKKEMSSIMKSKSLNQLSSYIKATAEKRSDMVAGYIQNLVNKNIVSKWGGGVTVRQIIQKFAKAFGKSKKAFKTFDNLRKDPNNFNAILDLIPVWIMELDDASRIIPLEAGLFDYVILDEASQCNVAYTLPVMFRSNHVLFVGDSEQMRDSTIMFKSNKVFDELAHRYGIPEERQIKATGSAVQSVLDIAKNRGFLSRALHYHYRSPAELINFSNKYFYKPNGKDLIPLNSNYLTYKDTNRVMVIHHVKSSWSEEFADNVNVAEAKQILKLFRELRGDDRYKNKSVGILSFFNAQATEIRRLFTEAGYREEDDNYKVSVIEGIQGDEKDVIIYSFVIRSPDQKNKYIPLTGEGGDINADVNKGRVNVAFSRARMQVHCFVSIPISEMPDRIWLRKYLEYVQEFGEIDELSSDLKPFDSYFEEEFYRYLRASFRRGYDIKNQVESCGFKLDFVVANTKTGKKLVIECDGPTHFENEVDEAYGIYVETDEERQRVLEAAGWRFCRVKYSDWMNADFDRMVVSKTIREQLG